MRSWQPGSVDLWFLEDAVSTAQNAGSPGELVAAALAARHHSEMLIAQGVEEMRRRNVTWSVIAECLGVSRQAAQKRYGGT